MSPDTLMTGMLCVTVASSVIAICADVAWFRMRRRFNKACRENQALRQQAFELQGLVSFDRAVRSSRARHARRCQIEQDRARILTRLDELKQGLAS